MSGTLAGTGTLVRFMMRRDRVRLPAWASGVALFWLYYTRLVPTVYDDIDAARGLVDAPMGRMFTGPSYGFDQLDYGRFITGAYGLYVVLLVALMSILLVVRHTRVEEQAGRAELVRANVVGRHAPLTAAMFVAVVNNAVVMVAVAVVSVTSPHMGPAGAAVFAASVGAAGLAFAGLAAVTAQVTGFSRAAAGLAGAGLGVAFLLRALGDMARPHGSLLSWLSPLAWSQQTAPFVLDRWWPLALSLVFAGTATAAGYALSSRRDLGGSLLATRAGRDQAPQWLGSPLTLALRLQRASIIGWTASLAAAGLVYGAFTDLMLTSTEDLPGAVLDLTGRENVVAGYLGLMALFMALMVGIFAVLAVQGLRAEEARGRTDPVLATPVSRTAWIGCNTVIAVFGIAAALAATGLGTGVGAAIVTGDAALLWRLPVAHLTYAPAVAMVLASAVLLFGAVPRLVGAAWALLGFGLIVGVFGPLMDLPGWLSNLSPFGHVPRYPLEPVAGAPLVLLTLLAAAAAMVGVVTYHRRDINVA